MEDRVGVLRSNASLGGRDHRGKPEGRLPGAFEAAKAQAPRFQGPAMLAIGIVAIFLVVFGALNLYEFGRID